VDIRPLRPDGNLEDELDLTRRSFGPVEDADRGRRLADARTAAGEGRYYEAFDGDLRPAGGGGLAGDHAGDLVALGLARVHGRTGPRGGAP
jgi:hypothetical protein